jgi:CubicO group peptidase (beta-lactamase class C family)
VLDTDQIDRAVREQHARQAFSGVIQVREDSDAVLAEAFGDAIRAEAVQNTTSTRFGTASGTKTFTAVAVCQLVEAGEFSYESRLIDIVDIALPQFDPGITVHQLLTHTSGAPDYFDEEQLDAQADFGDVFKNLHASRVRAPSDLLPLFQNEPMKFPPGERFGYNNGAYVLLGVAIESASGMPYADYVERHVFGRARMADSGFFEMNDLPRHTAYGYLADGRTNIYEVPIKGLPDGGAFVTAADMSRFWDALLGHQLLNEESTTTMLRPHIAVNPNVDDSHYGYGIWVFADYRGATRYSISGADPGVAFVPVRFLDSDTELTILGNTESAAWPMFTRLKQLILDD